MCSLVITSSTGNIVKIALMSNLGNWKWGRVKMPASLIGVKSTNPKKTEAVYPAMIAIRIGMVEKKPLKRTDPNTAKPSVIKK